MAWELSPTAAAADRAIRPMPYEGGGPWDPANCVLTPVPHAAALASLIRATFPWSLSRIAAIRCSSMLVNGTYRMSLHSVGRALDIDVPTNAGPEGEQLANWLVANADRLGLQLVIWNRSVWQSTYPVPRLRPYTGTKTHEDHVHVEVYSEPGPMLTAALAPAGVPFPPEPLRPPPTPAPRVASASPWGFAIGTAIALFFTARRRRRGCVCL